ALLESEALVFRGAFRFVVLLKDVSDVRAEAGVLSLTFGAQSASFQMGPAADTWVHKIRHPRTLMDKLGVKPTSRVAVIGVGDSAFWEQLRCRTEHVVSGEPRKPVDLIVFQADTPAALDALEPLQRQLERDGAIW